MREGLILSAEFLSQIFIEHLLCARLINMFFSPLVLFFSELRPIVFPKKLWLFFLAVPCGMQDRTYAGVEPVPPTLKAQSPSPWMDIIFFFKGKIFLPSQWVLWNTYKINSKQVNIRGQGREKGKRKANNPYRTSTVYSLIDPHDNQMWEVWIHFIGWKFRHREVE